jgi:hypothetical protein
LCIDVDDGKLSVDKKIVILSIVDLVATLVFVAFIIRTVSFVSGDKELPHEGELGIYVLGLETEETGLVYSSSSMISLVRLNDAGNSSVFYQQIGGGSECVVKESPTNVCDGICIY